MIPRAAFLFPFIGFSLFMQGPTGDEILERVDRNTFSDQKIVVSHMVIHGRRETRTVESKSWQHGTTDSYTEFLAPAREKGTKMLKLKDMLWEFSPSTDRTIMISGHMLRQSLMGSDLSYEDMMEDPHLPNLYSAAVSSQDTADGRACWVLDLSAKKEDVAYDHRRIWVDRERYVVLRENLFARSGTLLKTAEVRGVMHVRNRWLAKSVLYRDVFREGGGTEFSIDSLALDAAIPEYLFSKASLRR